MDPYEWLTGPRPSPEPRAPHPRPLFTDPLANTSEGWAATALAAEVEAVKGAEEGTRNHTLNTAAFNLGQIVAGGSLEENLVVDSLAEAAEIAGLDPREIRATIVSGLTAGYEEPRYPAERPTAALSGPESASVPLADPSGLLGLPLWRSELSGLPKSSPLVEGVLSTPAAVVVVGGYSVGKSVLVHGIAAAVALGVPWLGRPTRSARVGVVVGEGAWGLHDRIGAWEAAWNQGRPIPDDRLRFLVKPASLAKPATWAAISAWAIEAGIGLVVLDTFSSLAPDADETKDAARIMRWLSDLSANIDGTAILVHHPGWSDSGRTRGGYQFEANADEVLVLSEVTEGDPLIKVLRKKVKDGPSGAEFYVRRITSGPSVIFQHAIPEEADGLPAAIVACLADVGSTGATGPQIMEMLGVADGAGKRAFYRGLQALRDAGRLRSEGGPRSERHWLSDSSDS